MTVSYTSRKGTLTAATTSPFNVQHNATVNSGEKAVLCVITRTSNDGAITAPSGFALVGISFAGGGGSWGSETGPARVAIFEHDCDGSEDGTNISVTWDTGASAQAAYAQVIYLSKSEASWATSVGDAAADTTADTSWSVTTGSLAQPTGAMVVALTGMPISAGAASSHTVTTSGVTFGAATELEAGESGQNNNVGIVLSIHPVTTGATGVPTYTFTAITSPTGATALAVFADTAGGGGISTAWLRA